MPDTNNPIRTSGSLPDDYREVLYWGLAEKPGRVISLQIVGSLFFVIAGLAFFALAFSLGKLPASFSFGLSELILLIAGAVLTVVLHELTHGWVMRSFGARPSYGILWNKLMFYATSPGYAYPRNAYMCIALAPLVLISALAVLGIALLQGTLWPALLALCGSINAGGAIGDIWVTIILLRYPAAARVMDERDGVRVFLPRP